MEGLRFQPVIKKLIVRSDWHTWDREDEDLPEYPDGGEPESYVLEQPHSAATSKRMGELWELVLNESGKVHRARRICTRTDIFLLPDSSQGEDMFRTEGVGYIYVTQRAKDWLVEQVGEYVAFQAANIGHTASQGTGFPTGRD